MSAINSENRNTYDYRLGYTCRPNRNVSQTIERYSGWCSSKVKSLGICQA